MKGLFLGVVAKKNRDKAPCAEEIAIDPWSCKPACERMEKAEENGKYKGKNMPGNVQGFHCIMACNYFQVTEVVVLWYPVDMSCAVC